MIRIVFSLRRHDMMDMNMNADVLDMIVLQHAIGDGDAGDAGHRTKAPSRVPISSTHVPCIINLVADDHQR